MVLTIKISDDLYEKIGKLNPQNPRHAIERLLAKYAEAGYSTKAIVLAGKDLAEVQKIVGQIEDPAGLIRALQLSTSITIGDIEVSLSEGQWKRLKSNAAFYNQAPEDFAKEQIKRGLQSTLGV